MIASGRRGCATVFHRPSTRKRRQRCLAPLPSLHLSASASCIIPPPRPLDIIMVALRPRSSPTHWHVMPCSPLDEVRRHPHHPAGGGSCQASPPLFPQAAGLERNCKATVMSPSLLAAMRAGQGPPARDGPYACVVPAPGTCGSGLEGRKRPTTGTGHPGNPYLAPMPPSHRRQRPREEVRWTSQPCPQLHVQMIPGFLIFRAGEGSRQREQEASRADTASPLLCSPISC